MVYFRKTSKNKKSKKSKMDKKSKMNKRTKKSKTLKKRGKSVKRRGKNNNKRVKRRRTLKGGMWFFGQSPPKPRETFESHHDDYDAFYNNVKPTHDEDVFTYKYERNDYKYTAKPKYEPSLDSGGQGLETNLYYGQTFTRKYD